MPLGLVELDTTATFLFVFGALMAACALLSRLSDRYGVPLVLVFLILGMVGGSEGLGGIEFNDVTVAFRLGTVALILILFDGGLATSWTSIRQAAAPAGLLATVGVAVTGLLLTLAGRLLGLSWAHAMLIGAIVSSTDAAAVFAVLRGGGLRLQDRVRSTLEVESCVNDPMAVILTVTVIEVVRAGSAPPWTVAVLVPLQLVLGVFAGVAVALLTRLVVRYVRLSTAGLYPVVTLAAACGSFGAGTLIGGSGFLAVFVTGAVLGNGTLPYKVGLRRVHDALAWLSQVGMFLMLGLLVFPSQLLPVAGVGLAMGLFLSLVARPLAVAACLAPLGWKARETGYVGWVGLRGAVPIVLATFPVMAEVPGAARVFHIVFFIVVLSTLVPGASIVPFTRWLGLGDVQRGYPAASLELHTLRPLRDDLRLYVIEPSVAAAGAKIADLDFPEGAAIVLIVRQDQPIAARGRTVLQPGDSVYVMCHPEDEPQIGLLLGPSAGG